jgi:hypothetical protein
VKSTPSFWTPATLLAIGIALLALAVSVAAYLSIEHAQRLAAAVATQRSIAVAYEDRALRCLDHTVAALGAGGARRAERSLNMSEGITLCLVQSRENARLDETALRECIRHLEAANLVAMPGEAGVGRLPAC